MSDVDTNEKRRNKRWPEALKREIVAATSAPGASVSVVARQDDVNANQVFAWRQRFLEAGKVATPALVPLTILPEPADEKTASALAKAEPAVSDMIEIEVGGDYRIRVGSSFDDRALRRVLDVLRKR